jgi:hypothetical protein
MREHPVLAEQLVRRSPFSVVAQGSGRCGAPRPAGEEPQPSRRAVVVGSRRRSRPACRSVGLSEGSKATAIVAALTSPFRPTGPVLES